jgi:hypothetical protein
MARLLLILGLALAVVALIRWFINAPAARIARVLRRLAALALLALAGFLALRGAAGLAVPLALTAFAMLRNAGGGGMSGAPSGRTSEVRTRLLRMELDHDTGRMRGEVLSGRFAGRALEGLEDEELTAFWQECAGAGDQSLRLLRAWAERERPDWLRRHEEDARSGAGANAGHARNEQHGAHGRGGTGTRRENRGSGMTVEEALEVLGLSPGATEAEIRAAHRRLLKSVHPDHGGSDWLTRQINEARDVLLRALEDQKNG